ncbi:MAG: glucosamine-6-phosphate deaminase [Cyanobium sp.]
MSHPAVSSASPGRPGRLELIELPDPAAVAEQVAALLLRAGRRQPHRPLGLATGRTMEPVYGALARQLALLPAAEQQRLRQGWLSFNLDEYVGLAADDPRSFAAEMARRLVVPLGLDPGAVRLPRGAVADPVAEALRYRAELAAADGLGLQLLGLGLNGHVGFNEPPCAVDVACRCVALSETTRRQNAAAFGGDPAAVPARAITLGLAEILAAEQILLVVTGAAKAPVLRRLLEEPPTSELPASWLQRHPAVTLVVDRAALGRGGQARGKPAQPAAFS